MTKFKLFRHLAFLVFAGESAKSLGSNNAPPPPGPDRVKTIGVLYLILGCSAHSLVRLNSTPSDRGNIK